MSRIAKNPVSIPSGVEVKFTPTDVVVKGPKGEMTQTLCADVTIALDNNELTFVAVNESKHAQAMSGTLRALLHNMVTGVSQGFEKKLQLIGVGYRAKAEGQNLNLSLGFSHPLVYAMPEGITAETPTQTEIVIKGADKQQVGQVAAKIRAYRPPEPYKGKGVRYVGEVVVMKETKKK